MGPGGMPLFNEQERQRARAVMQGPAKEREPLGVRDGIGVFI